MGSKVLIYSSLGTVERVRENVFGGKLKTMPSIGAGSIIKVKGILGFGFYANLIRAGTSMWNKQDFNNFNQTLNLKIAGGGPPYAPSNTNTNPVDKTSTSGVVNPQSASAHENADKQSGSSGNKKSGSSGSQRWGYVLISKSSSGQSLKYAPVGIMYGTINIDDFSPITTVTNPGGDFNFIAKQLRNYLNGGNGKPITNNPIDTSVQINPIKNSNKVSTTVIIETRYNDSIFEEHTYQINKLTKDTTSKN